MAVGSRQRFGDHSPTVIPEIGPTTLPDYSGRTALPPVQSNCQDYCYFAWQNKLLKLLVSVARRNGEQLVGGGVAGIEVEGPSC